MSNSTSRTLKPDPTILYIEHAQKEDWVRFKKECEENPDIKQFMLYSELAITAFKFPTPVIRRKIYNDFLMNTPTAKRVKSPVDSVRLSSIIVM